MIMGLPSERRSPNPDLRAVMCESTVKPEFQFLAFPELSREDRMRTRSSSQAQNAGVLAAAGPSSTGSENPPYKELTCNLKLRRPTLDQYLSESKNPFKDFYQELRHLFEDTERLSVLTASKAHFKFDKFVKGALHSAQDFRIISAV